MKNIITKIKFLACILLTISMAACKSKGTEPTPVLDETAFEVSATDYAHAIETRTNAQRSFEIKDIKRENEILRIWVRGGCDKSNYKVVWDGLMRKSYPLTVYMVVTLETGTGVECAAELDHVLEINLKEKFGEFYDKNPFYIQLSNGSKVSDKIIDPQGIVSNK